MPAQRFLVNGVDYTDYLKADGLRYSRNDIDASGSGRDKSGQMRRKRVAIKAKLQISLRDLWHSELAGIANAIEGETISVTYLDPRKGVRTATFYGSSIDASTSMSIKGDTLWKGASFNLIEV